MTSRYPPPPRRSDQPRSTQQPRHSSDSNGSNGPRPPAPPRSPRELRDTWHTRQQRESFEPRAGRDRGDYQADQRSDQGDRYQPDYRDPYRARDHRETSGTHDYRRTTGSRDYRDPADQPELPERRSARRARGYPDPGDSQALRSDREQPMRTTGPQPFRSARPQDPRAAGAPGHPQDPQAYPPARHSRHSDTRHGTGSQAAGYPRQGDSGEFRVPNGRAADTGSYRAPADRGGFRTPSDTGGFRRPADTGGFRAPADTGGFRTPADTGGFRMPSDAAGLRTPADTGGFGGRRAPGYPNPSDSGEFRRLPRRSHGTADSGELGGYRAPGPADSGELRLPRRSSSRADFRAAHEPPDRQDREYRSLADSQEFPAVRASSGNRPAHEPPYDAQSSWRDQDDLALFEQPGRRGRQGGRGWRSPTARRVRKRIVGVFIVLALLAGLGAGAWFGWQQLSGIGDVPDYAGTGESHVIAHVVDGASTADIGAELARLDVVASGKAFVLAAQGNSQIRSVQPGYYRMRTKMSGSSAVSLLLEPTSRVGQLEIRGGMQLDDVILPDGTVVPGILSLISTASAAELNGAATQVPVDQLRLAMETTDPAALGVPEWAVPGVQAAEPRRRLEGLIVPGIYDVKPGAPAAEVLKDLVTASALRLQASPLTDPSKNTGFSPYELLVISSLIEKEGIAPDFGKVSRVIYNRMAGKQRLQLDSTINYPLESQQVTTSDEARQRSGPYNTYLNTGLTPTPIGAPSDKAIAAAVGPEPGNWRFFVKCQTDGTSCFAETPEQHQANVDDARSRGVF